MKLIKITDDRYVVVDETIQPVNGYYYDSFIKAVRDTNGAEYGEASHCWQITHSTIPKGMMLMEGIKRLSLQEVKELIGEVDVEKKADEKYDEQTKSYEDDINDPFYNYPKYLKIGFIDGYNQSLEDNKEKKYTEEDLRKVFLSGVKWDTYKEDEPEYKMNMEEVFSKTIQSLQPKTEWEVQMVEGKLKLK